MIVYHVMKADMDVLKALKQGNSMPIKNIIIERCSEGRQWAEKQLELFRNEHCTDQFSRLSNLFVFPESDYNERAFNWARKFSPNPGDTTMIFILKLEVDTIQWHDSSNFENLYLLSEKEHNDNELVSKLCHNYWTSPNDISPITIEGITTSAKIESLSFGMVSHNKLDIIERYY